MRYTINEQIDAMNIKSVDFNLRESVRALTDKDLVDFKSTYTSTPGILKSAIYYSIKRVEEYYNQELPRREKRHARLSKFMVDNGIKIKDAEIILYESREAVESLRSDYERYLSMSFRYVKELDLESGEVE